MSALSDKFEGRTPDPALKTKDARDLVLEARIELDVAIAQSIQSDDQIIMNHMRKAHALLSAIDTTRST